MASVIFRQGTQSAYDNLQVRDSNTLYIITDTHRIYKGSELAAGNVFCWDALPEAIDAESHVLYVTFTNGEVALYVKDESDASNPVMRRIGGGVATEIADGSVTYSKLNDSLVSHEIGEEVSDEVLPTEKAVKDYVESVKSSLNNSIVEAKNELAAADEALGAHIDEYGVAFKAVATAESENEGKFLLRFTDFNGGTHDVELDKEKFLKEASLSEDGKILTLELTDGSKFDIDLPELVANAKTVKTVDEIVVTTTVGELKSGTTIAPGTSVEDLFVQILSKDKDPSKTDPKISAFAVTGNGATLTDFEVGTSVTPQWASTFNAGSYTYKSDVDGAEPISPVSGTGVTATAWSIKQAGIEIGTTEDGTAASAFIIGDGSTAVTGSVSYSAEVTHTAGNYALTQLNKLPATSVRIAEGTKSASDTLTFFRKMFGGGTTADTLDSVAIRSLGDNKKAAAPTTADSGFVFNAGQGSTKVVFAYPKALTSKTPQFQIFTMAWGDTTGFVSSEVEVADVRGGENGKITYTVWTYTPAGPLAASNTQYRVYFK